MLDVLVQVAAGVFLDDDGIINKLNGSPNDPGMGVPFSALRDGVEFDSEQPLLGSFPYADLPVRAERHQALGASRRPRGTR